LIKQPAETKYCAEQLLDPDLTTTVPSPYSNFNSPISTQADWYRVLPQLSQGVDVDQRIGNVVIPSKVRLHLNCKFSKNSNDSNARDITVVVYVLKAKGQNQYLIPGGGSTSAPIGGNLVLNYNSYLDKGDGTDTAFSGYWRDSTLPINREAVVLHNKRTFRLYKPAGVLNSNESPTAVSSAQEKLHHSMHFDFKPKKLKYDTVSAVLPTNFAYCFAVGYYYNDGTAPDTGGGLLQVSARTEMWYKDE